MPMTPERVAERVEGLIESIRHALGHSLAEHNAALTISYISQLSEMGIISAAQFHALVRAVSEAVDEWQPSMDKDGVPLND